MKAVTTFVNQVVNTVIAVVEVAIIATVAWLLLEQLAHTPILQKLGG